MKGHGTYVLDQKTIVNPMSMRELTAPGHVMNLGRAIAFEDEKSRKQDMRMARGIRQAEKYQRQVRKEKALRLERVRREILPKILRKLFLTKKRDHFDHLTFGLLTFKADKQNHRWHLLNNLVETVARKTHHNQKLAFKKMVEQAHESSYSAFNFSDEYDFDSLTGMSPEVDRKKVHNAMKLLSVLQKIVTKRRMDFWLNLRVDRSFAKSNSMLTSGDENRRDPALRSTAVGSELFKGSVDYPLNSVRVEENKEQPASKL